MNVARAGKAAGSFSGRERRIPGPSPLCTPACRAGWRIPPIRAREWTPQRRRHPPDGVRMSAGTSHFPRTPSHPGSASLSVGAGYVRNALVHQPPGCLPTGEGGLLGHFGAHGHAEHLPTGGGGNWRCRRCRRCPRRVSLWAGLERPRPAGGRRCFRLRAGKGGMVRTGRGTPLKAEKPPYPFSPYSFSLR